MKIREKIILLLLLLPTLTIAQEGGNTYHFLRLPYSAHAAALGGANISLPDDDLTLAMHNPALLANVSSKTLNFNFMTYMSNSNIGSAAFNYAFGERSSAAVMARYVDYGRFEGYDPDNMYTGTFGARDVELSALYCYLLGGRWSGGVTAKFIYSGYESYNSFAMGVDLGVNYYNEEQEFSFSVAARNLGGQLKAFEDKHEIMPIDFQIGVSKRFAHAPIRLSLTLDNLHRWSNKYFYSADGKKDNFGEILLKHITIGADFLVGKIFYASLGYNYRIADELSASGSKWQGISAGAGISVKGFKFGASYSHLHVSSSSLLFNASYTL